MGHPDFRIGGKIFATLGSPDRDWAMVKLAPDQQRALVAAEPAVFQPCSGAWGRSGCTGIRLSAIRPDSARSVQELALENVSARPSPKKPTLKKPTLKKKPSGEKRTIRAESGNRPAATARTDETDNSPAVTRWLAGREHPLHSTIGALRKAVLAIDGRVREGVKWNSPSFWCHGWFATIHAGSPDRLVLVLHLGAKSPAAGDLKKMMVDPSGLLTWPGKDRATVVITSADAFKKMKKPLAAVLKQWVQHSLARAGSR